MFSSALKSFSSNITSNYTISQQPTSISGPWKIYDGKKRSGGKLVSVFVFDKKSLEAQGGFGRSSGGAGLRQVQDEVIERLRKEAASLARLRHPSILELAEPVEDTQSGGLRFATEPVTSSLAGLLDEKTEQERSGGVAGRTSKYVVDDPDGGGKKRREIEIDELEIQKGLLQIAKGLEFLHESAGLVHGNLTPEAIFVNAKSDWKISGLGFCTPPAISTNPSAAPMALSEVLNHDPRLPKHVQLNLDYASPDFVMDTNITTAADIFALGLVIVALYNNPHRSPLDTGMSVSTYRRLLSSPSTTPTQRNNYLSKEPIPEQVSSSLLPRLITRRPAQRCSAREFQEAQYFDSILVSTLRFLDNLPAKTTNEKLQFMKGLPRIMPQFPKSVLEKKVLPALLEEMKDHELLSPILEDVFKVVETVANGKRVFGERVIPRLRETFLTSTGKPSKGQPERDTSKEGGLAVILEQLPLVVRSCSGKEFKEDILPIVFLGLDSLTHSIQDTALSQLSVMLPVLDFSTIKNDLFPVVAHVFSKTSSMAIKIRGLEAFNVLCGGSNASPSNARDLMGSQAKSNSSAMLDKYTIQEKVVPLLKGIRTKEPAVMMAALEVFKQVGKVADAAFLAFEVLPVLWAFSLGPLLNLDQFQDFMALIKFLSTRIEDEQTRKLQQLGGRGSTPSDRQSRPTNGAGEDATDFESLVTGRTSKTNGAADESWDHGWGDDGLSAPTTSQQRLQQPRNPATFAWSTSANPTTVSRNLETSRSQISRTVTPDQGMSSFTALAPSKAGSQSTTRPSQHQNQPASAAPQHQSKPSNSANYANWSSTSDSSNPWASSQAPTTGRPQSSTSATNPWASIPTSNNWSSQTNKVNSSLSNMKIEPPTTNRGPGAFGQINGKPGGSLDNWGSLL